MLTQAYRWWFALPLLTRWAIVLWFALLAGVSGRVLVSPPTAQTVLPIYLGAGERWLAGEPLYPAAFQTGGDVYRNPPGVAAAFTVLTPWPEKLAGIVWRLTSAAVFLWVLARFRQQVFPDWTVNQTAVMFALAVILALPAVNNGQVNLLIAASALGGIGACVRGRWWEAAGWFALGGWLKIYPLAVGLLAGLVEPRRLLPRLLLVAGIGFLVPLVLQNPEYVARQYQSFVETQMADDRTYAGLNRVQRDWTVVTRSWLDFVPPPPLTKSVSFIAALACALAMGLLRHRPHAFECALLFGLSWMTIFGPATESHTYAQLAGLVPILLVAAWGQPWRIRLPILAGYGLLASAIVRAVFPEDWRYTLLGPQPIGTLLVFCAGLILWTRRTDWSGMWEDGTAIRVFTGRIRNRQTASVPVSLNLVTVDDGSRCGQ